MLLVPTFQIVSHVAHQDVLLIAHIPKYVLFVTMTFVMYVAPLKIIPALIVLLAQVSVPTTVLVMQEA